MPLEHDELLVQEYVFEHQFRFAASKIQNGIEGKGLVVQLWPTTETLFDGVAQRIQVSSDEGREVETHGILPWSTSGGPDYAIESDPKSQNINASWR